jgi:uncharacterized protein YuzE
MKINYDKVADAIYFCIKAGKVAKTIPVNQHLNIDVDNNGETIGIELLEASSKQGLELEKMVRTGVPVSIINGTPAIV